MPHLLLNRVSTVSRPPLEAVSLAVHDGECLAMLGHSGSGKSNLLETIAGFIPPISGEIRLDGQRLDHLKPAQRRIGMVFQDYALYPNMSVRKNLLFGMRVRHTSANLVTSRLQRLLSCLPLQPILDTAPSALTMLEQAATALGRAIIDQPDLVLLDEPLVSLPNRDHSDFIAYIGAIRNEYNPTMLYAASSPDEAAAVSDAIAVMRNGTIAQTGSADALYYRPIDIHVAGIASMVPPAKLYGTVSIREHGPLFVIRQGTTIPLAPILESRLVDGQPVTLLVRPEHVHLVTDNTDTGLKGRIISIRRRLPDILVFLDLTDGTRIAMSVSSTEAEHLTPDSMIGFEIDTSNSILFDRITGDALY